MIPSTDHLWFEADVSIQGRPGIVIMIAEAPRKIRGTKFIFDSLMLMRTGDYAEWPNSALPLFAKTSSNSFPALAGTHLVEPKLVPLGVFSCIGSVQLHRII
jgi:hypothetical protein